MKRKGLFLLVILAQLIEIVSASGYRNYDTKPVYGEEYAALISEISDFILVDGPERDRMIKCFAISEEGKIALAFDGEYAQIDVYQADGTYLYGYSFENRNCAFSVFFEGENLSVYHVKGGFVATFDASGHCIQIHRALNTNATNEAYHNDFYRPSSGQIGRLSYEAEKTVSMTKYSRFTVEDVLGNRIVIFEVSKESNTERILSIVVFTGIVVAVWFGVNKYKREFQEHD